MGFDLGENTPINIKLSRENFNALIGRHGQQIRWLTAEKCPCIGDNQKPDESCVVCKGKGVTYRQQTTSERVKILTAPIDGVIDQDNVIWVRDLAGNEYTVTTADCVAYVDGVIKGRQYQVKYTEDVTESGTGTATYIADKLDQIDLPTLVEFGTVQGDLLTVTADNAGTPLTVTSLFRNCFEISDTILPGDVVTVSYTYVNPFVFGLIHNNFDKADRKWLSEISGDGLMIFPQRWEVNANDIIIALNATETKKEVVRNEGEIDSLPSFYVNGLKNAYSIRADVKYEFTPGTDYVLYKGNQIKWINNQPDQYEQLSHTYLYNTVYRVMSDLPDPRTSEDNRFPRKVALKMYTDYNTREGF